VAQLFFVRPYACSPIFRHGAAQLFAADDSGREFMELVLADMRRPFPTDAELSQRLVDHRKDFEQLVAMAKADNELVRVAPDDQYSRLAAPRFGTRVHTTKVG
jgi:hypothetical protein